MATTPEQLPKSSPQALKPIEPIAGDTSSPQKIYAGFKQKVLELMQEEGVNPQMLVDLGQFARATIKDKALYPIFKQALFQNKIAEPGEIKEGVDYQMLAYFVMLGKVASQLGGAQ
jgi:hypothetical protein